MAALYTLCLLAPGAAMAFNGPAAAHCLTKQHHLVSRHQHGTKTHVHADGATHHHVGHDHDTGKHSDSGGKSTSGNCCGLFCMTALSQEVAEFAASSMNFTAYDPSLDSRLTGRVPEGLNRPPNT